MKIHVHDLPVDGGRFTGTLPAEILELEDPGVRKIGPVRYDLRVSLDGDQLQAHGTLDVDLGLECVSCLRAFQHHLSIDPFFLELPVAGASVIDLTPAMREDILLAFPAHPRCDWDGSKVCPGPKVRPSAAPDTETSGSAAWDALNNLKLKPNQ